MNREIKQFSAKWSFTVWIITIIFGLVVTVIICRIIYAFITGAIYNEQTQAWVFLVGVIPLTIIVLTVLFAPVKYTITNSMIIVNRLGPNVLITIESIEEIRRLQKKELGIALRLFGSGGFLGGYGLFYTSRLGIFNAYVTNRETLVFIKCDNGKKILLSPERPEEFLDIVAQARKQLSSTDYFPSPGVYS